jgi:hypothetical protein
MNSIFTKSEIIAKTAVGTETKDQHTALETQPTTTRGPDGRFQTGNSGGGRSKGSRNKITDLLMTTIVNDFAAHGADAIERLRQSDPASYLRIVTSLVPRELILQREVRPVMDYAELTDDEFIEILVDQRRRRQVEEAMKSV